MNKTLIELTDASGEPVLIDPTAIVSVAPNPNLLVIPDKPRSRTIVTLGLNYIHFVTETSSEVRDLIRKTTDPLMPIDADTAEVPGEYDDDAPAPLPELPAPNIHQPGGAPAWHIGHIGPDRIPVVEVIRRTRGIEIVTRSDLMIGDEARAFGLALLAAADWTEDTTAEDEPADDTPARPGTQHDEDHATDLARDTANGL